jgi:hypothetical protein
MITEQLSSHATYSRIELSMAFSSISATFLGKMLGAGRKGCTMLRLVNRSMTTVVITKHQPAGARR